MPDSNSGILTALIAGLAALAGTVGGSWIKKDADVELARQKFYSDLVLKSLEQKTGKERLEMLTMLTETHLITDPDVQKSIKTYVKSTLPENVPQVIPQGVSLPEPLVPDARVYLLAGSTPKASGSKARLDALRAELTNTKYRVLNSKVIIDPLRPDGREIRYFNREDETQAEKIADYLRSKDAANPIVAKLYQDPSAKSGYIEIWLGR